MKGCPLRCIWCSNPESQQTGQEVMFVRSKCTGCGKCAALCREAAVDDVTFDIDRSRCVKCGLCTSKCYAGAKKMTGRQVTVREMMELIEKDRIFYTNSGGGVTVGGGEPAMQHGFVEELLKACRESHIHTAIETCGYGRWQDICGMFDNADQIFFDLKAIDPELHRRLTGVSNELILHNAEQAAVRGKDVIFRIPLIPGCNDSLTNIEETGAFVGGLSGNGSNVSIEILPYHDLGRDKYRWLDMDYGLEDTGKPDAMQVEELKTILKNRGCSVV